MGYDVRFLQIACPGTTFPVEPASAASLLRLATPFADPEQVRQALLGLPGARPGPGHTVDYLGSGLSYARFTVSPEAVQVDNNLNCKELLKVYEALRQQFPTLVIHDLQSGRLHDAKSFAAWWSRPL